MKHCKHKRSCGLTGFFLTNIYFFVGMFFYLVLFFTRIGTSPSWMETIFLIYGLIGVVLLLPYFVGVFGKFVVNEHEEECFEVGSYDEDYCEEMMERKKVTSKTNTFKPRKERKQKYE